MTFMAATTNPKPWVLPPLSNSWIMIIIRLYIAFKWTPNIDCYWEGAVPNLNPRETGTALSFSEGQEVTDADMDDTDDPAVRQP